MAMAVSVLTNIPDCIDKPAVTLSPTFEGDVITTWYVVDDPITRTCPVSGNVHTVYLDMTYTPDFGDRLLDRLRLRFGTPELGYEEYTIPTPVSGGSTIDAVAGTQLRISDFSLFGHTPPPPRMLNSYFRVTATDMPIPAVRTIRVNNAFNYTLPAANTIVNVYEDAGGGVAGASVGSVTTNAAGECSLTFATPLRDFVLRIGGVDYPLASGSTPALVTTNSTDKTDVVVALLTGAYAPVVAPIAAT